MICLKKLRFSSCPRAKIGRQGPLGSARAQPCLIFNVVHYRLIVRLHVQALHRRGKEERKAHSLHAGGTGLSLTAGGRGFSPATKRVAPGYFCWKIEEK